MKIKILLAAMALSTSTLAVASPYTDAFKTYAEEVDAIEKQYGYIGPELAIAKLTEVAPDVYMSLGSFIWGNMSNFGFNNNMTAVIFEDGVFVYNAGPNEAVAYSFHKQLKRITKKPVKWVAIENHQGHANMGASYWHDVGVKHIYSEKEATENFHKAFDEIKARYMASSGNAINATAYDVTDKYTTFEKSLVIDVGNNEKVILMDFGGGHTPTMAGAIMPSKNAVFSGDLGFNERLPGLFGDDGDYQEWIDSFNKMKGSALYSLENPDSAVVIPGHGTATSMDNLEEQTIGYFKYVEAKVLKVIEEGGGLDEARKVDQSKYKDKYVFEQLAEDNAQSIYETIMKNKGK